MGSSSERARDQVCVLDDAQLQVHQLLRELPGIVRVWQADPPLLHTMLASVALCEAAERLVQAEPSIKWPNDLLIDDRKVAGILAENYSGPPSDYTVLGCGVNVNQEAADFAGLGRPATSLQLAAGRPVHRGELLVICLERFDVWLAVDAAERAARLRRAWEDRLWARGRAVRLRDQGRDFTAVIDGLAADGSLVVRLDNGQPLRLPEIEPMLEASEAHLLMLVAQGLVCCWTLTWLSKRCALRSRA